MSITREMELPQTQSKRDKHSIYGYLPNDWKVVKLEDISIGKGTYGIGAPGVDYNEHLPRYLRITDIDDQGRLTNNDPKCVDDPEADKFILQKNDIVFARTGNSTGKTYLYKESDGKLVYAGFLIKFSIDPNKADARYVKLFTETDYYWHWVKIMSMRSGQPGINENEYAKLSIPLPNLTEQQKIAAILSTWEKAIELKEKLIEQKQEQKKGFMQKLLTGEVRLPGFEQRWESYSIEELAEYFTDGDWIEAPYLTNKGVLLIQTGNIGIGKYIEKSDKKYISEKSFTELKCTEVKPGDILICRLADPIGRSCIVPNTGMKMITAVDVAILRVKNNLASNKFINYLLNLPQTLHKMDSLGAGSTRKRISRKNLGKVKLMIPSLDEQNEIVHILSQLDDNIRLLENELLQLKHQKKGLIQRLFTGKVRVKA